MYHLSALLHQNSYWLPSSTPHPPTLQHATRRPPAAVSFVICSQLLVPEGDSLVGQTLRLSYQLRDALGRTAVQPSHLVTLRPLLTYLPGTALPPGLNTTVNELPSCDAGSLDPASGLGECSVVVASKYFPQAGVITANVSLQLRIR